MRMFLLGISTAALSSAAPAIAQSYDRGAPSNSARGDAGAAGSDMATRIEQLQDRVRAGVRDGTISRQEAAGLRQQIRQLNQLEAQYSSNGFTRQETADLQDEYRDVRQQVRVAEARSQYDRDDDDSGRVDGLPAKRSGVDKLIDRVTGKPDPR